VRQEGDGSLGRASSSPGLASHPHEPSSFLAEKATALLLLLRPQEWGVQWPCSSEGSGGGSSSSSSRSSSSGGGGSSRGGEADLWASLVDVSLYGILDAEVGV